jgi:membrane-associated phospholipid phosphatase
MFDYLDKIDYFASRQVIKLVELDGSYSLFSLISYFASFEFIAVFTTLFSAYYFYKEHYNFSGKYTDRYLLPLWYSLAVAVGLTTIFKNLLDISGPTNRYLLESSPAFPSGHAAVSVAFFGVIYFMYFKKFSKKIERKLFLVFILLMIFLIGLSRLVLDVHYLTDVIAGYIVGLCGLLAAVILSKKFK